MRGHSRRLKHAREAAIIGGWIGAMQSRVETMDDLDDVLGWFEPKPAERVQTPAEMIGAMRSWAIVTGGTLADAEAASDPQTEEEAP